MLRLLAVIASFIFVYFVVKSIVLQMFNRGGETAPDGFIQAGARWLETNGYTILQTENVAKYNGYVDNSTILYQENAHFIARKDGHEYAVFVGMDSPTGTEVAKHYFPLFMILDVQGLIFLNLSDQSVHHVDFKVYRSRRYRVRHMLYRGMWFTGGALFMFSWLHRM